jgi:tetratricopeptide (TPR) repeat protein
MTTMMTRRLIQVALLSILIAPLICRHSAQGAADARYEEFTRLVREGKKAEALDLGGRLFRAVATQNSGTAALILLSKRLEAVHRLHAVITGAVKPSPSRLLEGVAGLDDLGPVPGVSPGRNVPAALPPPAQELYWTYLRAFTGDLALDGLAAPQAAFLGRYYDLQVQDSIMKIGRQVIVADPNSVENACYALVLPLLYLWGRDNTWDQMESFLALFPAQQRDLLWRFALLQAERPQASAQIAQCQAQMAGRDFFLTAWAPAAADVCVANHRPDLAQKLISMAMDGARDRNQVAGLRLKIVEGYARSGDYAMAARTCRQIAQDLPDSSLYGRIMAAYFGYLAREAKADQIVTETEPALGDPRCQPYLPQILYLRWWALCKTNRQDEAVRIAQRLIEQYPDNPCVAPVRLERATDALARQQYDRCQELLTKLTKDFPGTESAKRAEEILARFQASGIQQKEDDLSQAKTGGQPLKGR